MTDQVDTPKGKQWFYKLMLLSCAIIWGSSFFILKDTIDVLPVSFTLGLRFMAAAILLGIIFFKRVRKTDKKLLLQGLILGVTMIAAYWFQTFGLAFTTPGKNAFLTQGYAIVVPFLYWLIAHNRPRWYQVVAAFLFIIGAGFISLTGNLTIQLGDLLTIVCCLFYALQIVEIAIFAQENDAITLTIWQFFFMGLFAIIVSLFTETPPTLEAFSPRVIASLAYLIIVVTAVALLLQNVALEHVDPAPASLLLSLEGVFGVLFSVIFYHESLTLRLVIGFIIVFVAVVFGETRFSFLRCMKHTDPGT